MKGSQSVLQGIGALYVDLDLKRKVRARLEDEAGAETPVDGTVVPKFQSGDINAPDEDH